jgi:hypothetical protein
MSMGTSAGPDAIGGQFAVWGVGERVAGCEFRHSGCGTDQMPDAQKGSIRPWWAFGSVCMIALFVLLSRATVSLSLPHVPPSLAS